MHVWWTVLDGLARERNKMGEVVAHGMTDFYQDPCRRNTRSLTSYYTLHMDISITAERPPARAVEVQTITLMGRQDSGWL